MPEPAFEYYVLYLAAVRICSRGRFSYMHSVIFILMDQRHNNIFSQKRKMVHFKIEGGLFYGPFHGVLPL